MKFNDLYNSIINEAKVDELLAKVSMFSKLKKCVIRINEKLNNKSKFVDWLIKNIEEIEFATSDYMEVVDALNYFDKNQSRFDEKDINRYKYLDFMEEVGELQAKQTRSEISKEASKDAPKIFENDKCIVLNILTQEASIKYGKGTKWCISGRTDNRWHGYHFQEKINFYFILPKEGLEKYAVGVKPNSGIVCYDSSDANIFYKKDDIFGKYNIDESIFESIVEPIEKVLDDVVIGTWTKNESGLIDVDGYVLVKFGLLDKGKFRVKFGKISSDFYAYDCNLTSLVGAPKEINGNFYCSNNQLTSLEYGPKQVGRNYDCSGNQLTSLVGAPKEINGNFYCSNNQLTSLEGCPNEVKFDFTCKHNPSYFTKEEIKKVCKVGRLIFV